MQIPSMDGEFVGMSLYFFVIDFLKTIYQMDDAHPTIDDIKTFGRSFCAMNWTLICLRKVSNRETLEHFSGKHRYTNDVVLGQRCFQVDFGVSVEGRLRTSFRFWSTGSGLRTSRSVRRPRWIPPTRSCICVISTERVSTGPTEPRCMKWGWMGRLRQRDANPFRSR